MGNWGSTWTTVRLEEVRRFGSVGHRVPPPPRTLGPTSFLPSDHGSHPSWTIPEDLREIGLAVTPRVVDVSVSPSRSSWRGTGRTGMRVYGYVHSSTRVCVRVCARVCVRLIGASGSVYVFAVIVHESVFVSLQVGREWRGVYVYLCVTLVCVCVFVFVCVCPRCRAVGTRVTPVCESGVSSVSGPGGRVCARVGRARGGVRTCACARVRGAGRGAVRDGRHPGLPLRREGRRVPRRRRRAGPGALGLGGRARAQWNRCAGGAGAGAGSSLCRRGVARRQVDGPRRPRLSRRTSAAGPGRPAPEAP